MIVKPKGGIHTNMQAQFRSKKKLIVGEINIKASLLLVDML